MSTQTLAIKPTRREIIKLVIAQAHERKREEFRVLQVEHRRLYDEARAANNEIFEIAQTYANAQHKTLLTKLKRLLLAEFPDTKAYFTIDLEKDNRSRFKPDGKAEIRLVVHDVSKQELNLPQHVRDAMIAAEKKSDGLFDKAQRVQQDGQVLNQKLSKYGHSETVDYQKLLNELVPALGEEAIPHLDALVALIEKTLEVKPPAPTGEIE